ncbi:MAG: hypothetical protein Kow0029_18380 [Candidatus Rifleibacteriota bacterium]
MNSLRGISRKIDAILLMVMAGLALSLALAYNFYQTRKLTGYEKDQYAAELLAYKLPQEAVRVLEESIRSQPVSDKSLRLRRTLADIYMKELNDYEKALGELVFIRTFSPKTASDTEADIRYCLNRLGRSYDVDRRIMLEKGINPVENDVNDNTVIRIGNKEAMSVAQLKARLNEMNIDVKGIDRQKLDAVVQALAREILLDRAAERENIQRDPGFIEQVRQFEKNLKLKYYLERFVLKDLKISEEEIQDFINKNAGHFKTPDRVKYSCFLFSDAKDAEKFIEIQKGAKQDSDEDLATVQYEVSVDQNEVPMDQLPVEIRSLNFEVAGSIEFFGPVKVDDKYRVYQIHEFIKGEEIPEQQTRDYARKALTEKKQQELLSKKMAELARKEELKINDEVIEKAFFNKASDSVKVEPK